MLSPIATVVLVTVVVSPLTIKSPDIVVLTVLALPIVILLFICPNLVSRLPTLTSTSVFVTLAVFAVTASNIVGDITPLTEVVATGMIALLPSEDAIVLAPVDPVILRLVLTFVFLAVLAVTASKIVVDITPETEVVATGIVALVPSEDAITLEPVLLATDKLVDTFVFLAVLAAIAELIELANLSAVTPSSANWVVPTPPAVIAMLSALAVIPVPPITFSVGTGPFKSVPVNPEPAPTPVTSPWFDDKETQDEPLWNFSTLLPLW